MTDSLAHRDVAVWHRATASLDAASLQADIDLLSPDEALRRARFVFDRDKRDFAAAHGLLRRVLSAHAAVPPRELRFHGAPNTKPALPADQAGHPPLLFSLSHTHGFVACAVSRGLDVGIDVESIDRVADADAVARRFFAPREIAALDACRDDATRAARFIELWTLKEAYGKAIGAGLAVPLDQFSFDIDDRGHIGFDCAADAQSGPFAFRLLSPAPGVCIGVAVRTGDPASVRVSVNQA